MIKEVIFLSGLLIFKNIISFIYNDERIFKIGKHYKVDMLMTSTEHDTGIDRCFEASNKLKAKDEDII